VQRSFRRMKKFGDCLGDRRQVVSVGGFTKMKPGKTLNEELKLLVASKKGEERNLAAKSKNRK